MSNDIQQIFVLKYFNINILLSEENYLEVADGGNDQM